MNKRLDLLTTPHQEQRSRIYDLGKQLGAIDYTNTENFLDFKQKLENFIKELKQHSLNEGVFIMPLIKPFDKETVELFEIEHSLSERRFHELLSLADKIENADNPEQKKELGLQLYRLFNLMVGEYLVHIFQEENTILDTLWKNYSDLDLTSILVAFKCWTPHERAMAPLFVKSTLANLSAQQIDYMLQFIQSHLPNDIYTLVAHSVQQQRGDQNLTRNLTRRG